MKMCVLFYWYLMTFIIHFFHTFNREKYCTNRKMYKE